MDYLETLRQDVLEYLIYDVKGENIEDRHEQIHVYVFDKMRELRKSILEEYNDHEKYRSRKDRKAILDDFLDNFSSSDWKNYYDYTGNSKAELRKLKANCLIQSSATENLLNGKDIVPKSKDFYSVYLDYCGWKDFKRKKSKNRNHKNIRNTLPKELTVKFPKLWKKNIVGRTADINDLHQRLFDNKQVVLVNGMGGIGKTTVASVYATEYLPDYKHIAWISQLSGDFLNDFINAQGLLIGLGIDTIGKTSQELFDETVMKLKSIKDIPCLMVIDNANEELYKFYDLLPNQPNWHILATSREVIPHFDIKELGFLSKDEAIELFEKLYKRTDFDKSAIIKIVKYVDCHTLTIEILALTAKKEGLSLDVILTALEENIETGVIIKHSIQKITKITSYLCFIFKNMSELNSDEKWLLIQFACLPSEFHSEQLLLELIQPNERGQKIFKRLLSELSDKGWILINENNGSYKMHRIIADVVAKSLSISTDKTQPLLSQITKKLSKDVIKDNPIDKFKWIPYGEIILNRVKTNTSLPIITRLQNNLAIVLSDLGSEKNLLQAKSLLEKAMISNENNFGKEHPTTGSLYSNLAIILKDLGGKENLLQAKSLLEKAMISNENNFEKGHSINESFYSNLATVLQSLGGIENLLKAKSLLEKAIVSEENNFGKEHPTTIVSYSILATILRDLGGKENLLKAKSLLEKAKISTENNLGKEHPATAVSYSVLARVLDELGGVENLLQAKLLYEKAMVSDENNFGKEHSTTAIDYSNLADVLKDLGGKENLFQAKLLYEKAMISDENNFGKEHPTTAVRYSNLGLVLHHLMGKENLLQAKSLFEKAKSLDENNFGEEHPTTAVRYSNLATVLKTIGGKENLLQAKLLLEKAMVSDENNFGKEHPKTTSNYSNLATVLQDLGGKENLLQAKSLLEKAMVSNENNSGKEHPTTMNRYSNLALVLQDLGGKENLLQAKSLLKKAMVSAENNFGKEHPTTGVIYVNLATAYKKLEGRENLFQAKLLLEKAMKIFEESLGINHPYNLTVKKHLEKLNEK